MERQGNGRGRGRGRGNNSLSGSRACSNFAKGFCRKGDDCNFLHEDASLPEQQQQQQLDRRQRQGRDESGEGRRPRGSTEGRGQGRRSGGELNAGDVFRRLSSYSSLSTSDEFRDFLGSALAYLSDSNTPADRMDNTLQALCGVGLQHPSYAHTHLLTVLKDFRQRSSRGKVKAQAITDRIIPLLRLLTHEVLRESIRGSWVNPLYDTILHELDFAALSDIYTRIRSGDLPTTELLTSTRSADSTATRGSASASGATSSVPATGSECAGGVSQPGWRWSPTCMLDIIEPPVLLLSELLERFQRPEQRQVLLQGAAGTGASGSSSATEARSGGGNEVGTTSGGSSTTTTVAASGALMGRQQQAQRQQQQKGHDDGWISGLVDTLNALYERDLSEGGGTRGCGGDGRGGVAMRRNQGVRRRRFQEALRSVVAQLKLGESHRLILDEVEKAQRRQARLVAEAAATGLTRGQRAMAARMHDPEYLPGELRRAGPRHDNDKADFRQVQLVPTCGELLCKEDPYLPSNRAGSMPHIAHDPHRARLEVNFRLLRHDVVGPLAAALSCLEQSGGLARLGPLQQQVAGAGHKKLARKQRQQQVLRMDGGTHLFVFRDVRFEGLALTRYDGTVVQVTFEQPASASARCSSRREYELWWRCSKRLSVGTLLALWWEPQTARGSSGSGTGASSRSQQSSSALQQPPPQPRCVVGVVAQRDPEELSGKEERRGRPVIGIRLVNPADYKAMLGAWLDASVGDGGEVVLIQEHNSFFAYEPVLRALQGMNNIPLAEHLVPGCEAPRPRTAELAGRTVGAQGPAGTGALAAPLQKLSSAFSRMLSLGGRPEVSADEASQPPRPPAPDLPAYLVDRPQYDLRHIVDRERVAALSPAEQMRVLRTLSEVDLSQPPESFPMNALLAATTLDRAQAEALRSVMSQEVSVVQGPPGTGKTFLAVVLTRALLRNTCNTNASEAAVLADEGLPGWIAEFAGAGAGAAATAYTARPHIGPLLVVCFTNHALDSFLEGLLESGVTDSIIRVGGNSKSERLAAYNLSNLQEKARGSTIRQLHKRSEELTARAERLSTRMQDMVQGELDRSMKWEELGPLLRQSHTQLYHSFTRGIRSWNRRSAAAEKDSDNDGGIIVTNDKDDGFRAVGRGRKGRRAFRDLLSDDWLRGSPDADWRLRRLAGQQAGRAAMAEGIIQSDDEDEVNDDGEYELAAALTGPVPPVIAVLCVRQRPVEELLRANDVWAMSRSERRQLHAALLRLRYLNLLDEVRIVQEEYDAVQLELRTEYDQAALRALCRARVVGMTTSGVARMQRLVTAMKPRVLLVEEAAEVYEAHVLACLSRSVEQLVLIGDHEQLRPKPNVFELQAESGRGLDLDVSLFERLVRHSGFPVSTLEEQRRMRPEISRLIRETIYPQLRDHPRVTAYPHVRGLSQPLSFLDHDHPEGGAADEERSKSNAWEAGYVVALARHLLLQGYKPDDIVVLVTYAGQLHKVREELGAAKLRVLLSEQDRAELERAGESEGEDEDESGGTIAMLPDTATDDTAAATATAAAKGKDTAVAAPDLSGVGGLPFSRSQLPPGARVVSMKEGIRVATVDNYQGEEANVILLSTVRNNPAGSIGFLRMRNRVNVMLSRARHGMVVLGHAPTLRAGAARSKEPMWSNVLDCFAAQGCLGPCLKTKCVKHGNETEIREPGDFQRLVGDGGCQLPCGEALPCGHTCPRRCHVDDIAHRHVVCTRDCQRLLSPCGHPCNRRCGEPCGRCRRPITDPYTLECGHQGPLGMECWRRYEKSDSIPCSAMVEVTLPGCGHTLSVPCPQAEAARAGRISCTQPVRITMPVCGHIVEVPCGQRAAVLADPTRCPAVCGTVLEGCEHACSAVCGSCVRRALHGAYPQLVKVVVDRRLPPAQQERWRDFQAAQNGAAGAAAPAGEVAPDVDRWLQFVSANGPGAALGPGYMKFLRDNRPSGHHPPCRQPCTRELVCGHTCGAPCHPGTTSCRPCKQRCWLACPHHTCKKTCGEPCVSCAEPCVWRCEHQGTCGAPCGAPCDRLPCNVRCSRTLACGHRCPGLCGESCPSAQYCVDPACMETAEERVKNQRVDMVMFLYFADLTPEMVDEDPLLVLPCGHAFVTSTLDGLLEVKMFYACDTQKNWLHPLPLGDQQPKRTCPTCRKPIHGIRRYGRAINKASLDLIERKYMFKWQGQLGHVVARLKSLQQQVREDGEQQPPGTAAAGDSRAGGQPGSLQQKLRQLRESGKAPAGALVLVEKVQKEAATLTQSLLGVCEAYQRPPKQHVYEAALATLQRAEEEEARAEAAVTARDGGGTAAMVAAAELRAARLRIARQDLAALRPDTRMLSQARIGIVECAQVFLAAAAAGLQHVYKVLTAAEPQRGSPDMDELRKQASLLLRGAVAAFNGVQVDAAAPSWRRHAAATQAYNSAFELSAAAMRLGLVQLQVLRVAGQLVRGGHLGDQVNGTDIREMQEAVCEEIRGEGKTALDLYNGESGLAESGWDNGTIQEIQELLKVLEQQAEKELEMKEILSALSAIAATERAGADVLTWLNGHLYRCPNGHLYVIGNCGGAMQRSRCAECGAVIGGEYHTTAEGNRSAADELQQLRTVAGRGGQ